MTLQEAVKSLQKHLDGTEDSGVFHVFANQGGGLTVNVNFIYRIKDLETLNGAWEGFPVVIGRRSCW